MPGPQGAPDTQPPPGMTLNYVPQPLPQPEATPSSAGGMPMDPADREAMIRTIYGEASGESALGQAGVAHAILNRVNAGGYGNGIQGVIMAPVPNPKDAARGFHEFSPWNPPGVPESNPTAQHLSGDSPNPLLRNAYANIGSIVDKSYNGLIPDPTGGATHYYGYMPKPPTWAGPLAALNKVKIGNQTFVGGAGGPGRKPVVVAGGPSG